MKLRTMVGFGVGYVLGTRADPERYEQLQRLVKDVTQSETFKDLLERVKNLVGSGVQMVTGQQPGWASSGGESDGGESGGGGGGGQSGGQSQGGESSSEEQSEEE